MGTFFNDISYPELARRVRRIYKRWEVCVRNPQKSREIGRKTNSRVLVLFSELKATFHFGLDLSILTTIWISFNVFLTSDKYIFLHLRGHNN